MDTEKVEFYKSEELGKGLPFAITSSAALLASEDIYRPSLRNFHVLFWIKKGHGKYMVDFNEYSFEPNTIMLLSKNQLHRFHSLEKEVEIDSITFKEEFIYRSDSDLRHLFRFTSGKHVKGDQVLAVTPSAQSKFQNITAEMLEVYREGEQTYQAKAFYHLLCLFLLQCERLQDEQSPQLQSSSSLQTILQFNDLLERHFKKEFKVDFYADQMRMPLKSLSKLTKEHYKKSPKTVIDDRRILEIKRQLTGTQKSGKTIAYELHFGEPTNMFKYFKKHVGITPNEFREQTSPEPQS